MRSVITVVVAGFVCGLLAIVISLGNVTLLARGDLAAVLPSIAAVVLFSAAVLPLVTTFLSGVPGQVTTTQESPVVALAAVTGATTAAFAGPPDALLATVLVTIGITTLASGVAMMLLGVGRLGEVIRFVPYPVFAGFLAITGWYLFTGGVETVLGRPLNLETFAALGEPELAAKLAFAIALVVAIRLLQGRFGPSVLPGSVVVVVILFNVAVLLAGIPREALEASGWTIPVPTGSMNWPPVSLADIAAVDWRAVGQGLLFAPIVVVITVAAAMMNVSGIELEEHLDIDHDRELRAMGAGNIASGLAGGIPGFPALSATLLARRMGAASRGVGVVTAAMCATALVFAPQLLGIVPAPLLGGLLMAIGASLLVDWVIRTRAALRASEHAIILAILAVSIVAGLPAGIGVGLLAALALFTFEYAQVDAIRFVASGRDYHSRALSEEHRHRLDSHGSAIIIMKLSGYLFFGSSDRIVQRIRTQLERERGTTERFVVLDFRRVAGMDSSVTQSFERLRRFAERDGFVVVFAGLGELEARLHGGGLRLDEMPFHTASDLDAGVAWAEQRVLGGGPSQTPALADGEMLRRFLGDADLAEAMRSFVTSAAFAAGEKFIEQGSGADDIYFIEAGTGAVQLDAANAEPLTLMSFGPGAILGEIAFYCAEPRTASALAQSEIRAWQLTREALQRAELQHPQLAAAFHRAIARALALRLQSANRLIRVLAD